MTVRSIAQTALIALAILSAGASAHAESLEEKLIKKPLPAKLLLVDVNTRDCRDLEDSIGLVGSWTDRCGGLMGAMPEQRLMPQIKSRVRNVLFPRAMDENGKRTGDRVQRVAAIDERTYSKLNDYQVAFLAYQLGVISR